MPVEATTLLTNAPELLHRQVHPTFVRDGRISSQTFRPTPKDQGHLSVSRGTLVSADEAFRRFVGRGFESAGVASVSVEECQRARVPAYEDPLPDDDAHAILDFNQLASKSQWDKVADKLAAMARARGWRHGPR